MERDLFNFRNIAYNLLNTSDDVFERFFEKLYRMDKEYLYIYLITRRDKITKSQMLFAKKYYEKRNHYYNWNLKSIIVTNNRRVSSFLGFKINSNINILEKDECIDFIIKYNKYFNDVDINTFKSFTELTNLSITNMYQLKNSIGESATYILNIPKFHLEMIRKSKDTIYISSITFNNLGSSLDRYFNHEIHNRDLFVINSVDELILKDNQIIVDGHSIYELNNREVTVSLENENKCIILKNELYWCKTIEEKIDYIKKYYDYDFKENIKQIYLSSFRELFVLYENGELYKDNQLYAEDVLTIWEANTYVCYLIFKNYDIEYISSHNTHNSNQHYDKIIFNNCYLALLKNKDLAVISKSEDEDTNYHTFFSNVDNISFADNDIDINLEIENKKIIHCTSSFKEDYELK